jgi:hypothetical protein
MPGNDITSPDFKESKPYMNNHNDKKKEEIIEKVLQYLESGKTPAEIFGLFPKYQEELKEILSTYSLLKEESKKIVPTKESFQQIIDKINVSVTNELNPRYSYMEEVQGRPSLEKINNITKIFNLMNINWKIWAPVGIVAVVALVIIGSSQLGTKSPQAPITDSGQAQEQPIAVSQDLPKVAVAEPATGNVDDAVNAILASVSDDEALFADAIKDGELIAADNQSINNFGQSYYENEF